MTSPLAAAGLAVEGRSELNSNVIRVERSNRTTITAVQGATISATARTTAVRVALPFARFTAAHARPLHVNVLDPDGNNHFVRIADREHALRVALFAITVFATTARVIRSQR